MHDVWRRALLQGVRDVIERLRKTAVVVVPVVAAVALNPPKAMGS